MNFVVEVIPHLSSDPEKAFVNLEVAMQALVLDEHDPLALEMTGEGSAKRFLLRACRPETIAHAEAQLRMRYPQAIFEPVSSQDDPLICHPGEAVSVIELTEGADSYLPLQVWDERTLHQPGIDPLFGVLGALGVPEGIRAVAQIAMVPAPPTWSNRQQRLALEHALDPEKTQRQVQMLEARSGAPSTLGLIILAVLCIGLLLYQYFKVQMPSWVENALRHLIHGQRPLLTGDQWHQIGLAGGVLLLVILLSVVLRYGLQYILRTPLYDQKLAAQKTLSMAYRVRIRLYVIGSIGVLHRPFWRTTWEALRDRRLRDEWQVHSQEREERRVQTHHRETILSSLVAAYRQYHLARGNYFVPRHLSSWRTAKLFGQDWGTSILQAFIKHSALKVFPIHLIIPWLEAWLARRNWTRGVRHSKHLLAPVSLAMLWHLLEGQALQETPLLHFRRTRRFLLPEALITPASEHEKAIGVSTHGGQHYPFVPPVSFIRYHTLLGGQSGEGKSTLMQHMALQAIRSGSGCCVLDPHGDLAEQILASIPPERAQDTILIDFGAPDCSIGLNPLDVTLGRERDKAIEDLLVTLRFIWSESWGNRMESPFRHALLTLFEANQMLVQKDPLYGPDQQYTLLDVLPILTDESFCHSLLGGIEDDYLKRWWYLYYEPLSLQQQRERVDPVFTKISKLEMKAARRIIGQGRSTLHFAQLIRERKVILVNLAKGRAGSDTAPLLGSTLMGLLLAALQEQATLALADRVHLPIFIDEFQSLGGIDYQTMMAELRKWGGACCLATQSFAYLHEMNPALLPTVLANVKQKIIFRISAKDAYIIHEELDVEQEDIVHLDPHTCYVSLPYADRQQPTFSLYLKVPPVGDVQVADEIRVRSRQIYTRTIQEIDLALQTSVTRTIQAKSLQGQDASVASPPVEDKKRVRTRKGKESNGKATHGSLHALELLAVHPAKQKEEEEGQETPEEPGEQDNPDES
jgi:Type IV secretion-system coupling protein DNA-binding domain